MKKPSAKMPAVPKSAPKAKTSPAFKPLASLTPVSKVPAMPGKKKPAKKMPGC